MSGVLFAGLLSFLSPCILPMVPFYLSYLGGVSVHHVAQGADRGPGWRVVIAALCFAAGIVTVFVGLGASASLFGQLLRAWFDILRWIAAGAIAIMGLQFLGVLRLPFLQQDLRSRAGSGSSYGAAFLMGLAFAFGWTPCVGPVLAAILFTAAGSETAGEGMRLLLAYGIGMTAPFVLAALFLRPFLQMMDRVRPWLGVIERVMGVMLLAFAVLIATGGLAQIAQWMLDIFPIFRRIG